MLGVSLYPRHGDPNLNGWTTDTVLDGRSPKRGAYMSALDPKEVGDGGANEELNALELEQDGRIGGRGPGRHDGHRANCGAGGWKGGGPGNHRE